MGKAPPGAGGGLGWQEREAVGLKAGSPGLPDRPPLEAGRAGGEAGFTVYSGMLSVGACLGYLLTALDWGALGWLGAGEHTALLLVLVLYTACLGRYRISYLIL